MIPASTSKPGSPKPPGKLCTRDLVGSQGHRFIRSVRARVASMPRHSQGSGGSEGPRDEQEPEEDEEATEGQIDK